MMGADQLQLDRPQWPVSPFTVRKFGAFGVRRTNANEGACGTKPHPCTHWGVDLGAPAGTMVRVPFSGFVLYHGPANIRPFIGYGPWVALIAHHDRSTPISTRVWQWVKSKGLADIANFPEDHLSIRYSLIGHLAPQDDTLPDELPPWYAVPNITKNVPRLPLVDDIWDSSKKKPNPKHWRPTSANPSSVVMMSEADGASSNRMVWAGQQLGSVSDRNHVHWELRTCPVEPYASGNWRLDPIETFQQAYDVPLPEGVAAPVVVEPAGSSGGGAGLLLLAAALAFGSKKKRASGRRR